MAKKLVGSQYADVLNTGGQKNGIKIYGRGGDDTISSANNILNYLYGEDDADLIQLSPYTRVADGGDGDDIIEGFLGSKSKVYGGIGNDEINISWNYNVDEERGSGKKSTLKNALVSAGPGDDIINYRWYNTESQLIKTKKTFIRGDDGNDTLVVQQLTYSDQTIFDMGPGDDIIDFYGRVPKSTKSFFNGGDGVDTAKLNLDSFVSATRINNNTYLLTFAAWQLNGIAYEQKIQLANVEKISTYRGDININQLAEVADINDLSWQ